VRCRCLQNQVVLLFALLTLPNFQAVAQDSTYTYSFENFNNGNVSLVDSLKIWVDSTGSSTFDDVISNPSINFSRRTNDGFTRQKDAVWANFKIRNTSESACQVALFFCHLADSVFLYSFNGIDNGEIMVFRASTNPKTRPAITTKSILEVNIGRHQVKNFYAKIHLRPNISKTHQNHISLDALQSVNKLNTEMYMIQSFFAGVMVLFSLVSFIMYGSFKERMFIQFGVLMVCFMFYFLKLHRLTDAFITHNMPLTQTYLSHISVGIINLSLFYFVSGYINLKALYPTYYKGFRLFTFLVAVSAIIPQMIGVSLLITARINNILMITWIFGIIYPVVRQTLKKDKAARTLLISIGILFFGALLLTLSLLNVIPQTPLTKYGMQIGTVVFSSILFYGLFQKINMMKLDKLRIGLEKEKSDALLDNILPTDVATQLKETGFVEAQKFNLATVLFTDFKGFTQMSEKLKPTEIIEELNICFSAFDAICEKYKVEKIKTIGDAYMAVGGIPIAKNDSVKNTVLAGLEMVEFINKRQLEQDKEAKRSFQMRVGIHSGKLIAGIVGTKKFHYDVWGDTVNTASRMESSGEVGKVNISQATYELVKNERSPPAEGETAGKLEFEFESRGKIEAKGKGEVEMFFVSRMPTP